MNPPEKTGIILFRADLRLADNEIVDAAANHLEIIPLFIFPENHNSVWPMGEAKKAWLYHSLKDLDRSLSKYNCSLVIKKGSIEKCLKKILKQVGPAAIYCNRSYEDFSEKISPDFVNVASKMGSRFITFEGQTIYPPTKILKKDGTPYRIFTAYWNQFKDVGKPKTFPAIKKLPLQSKLCTTDFTPETLGLLPEVPWDTKFGKHWSAGESAAHKRLQTFISKNLANYETQRNIPSQPGTSFLSPYLAAGSISPQMIWSKISLSDISNMRKEQFLKELAWRDFAKYLLFYFPESINEPLRPKFKSFPWRKSKRLLKAWQQGMTGYPLIDAGMRQLWETGWMHNRVRMITSSFLTKNLRINWTVGARWYWDTLIDADLASNTMGWQWVAGCGVDASPFFRIFNPVTQSKKFDPNGEYIRTWIPELAHLPPKWIHEPWLAPKEALKGHGGNQALPTYPPAIVDLKTSRQQALDYYKALK